MAYVIAEPCFTTKDKACVPACPVDCIYEGPKMLFIHPEECIDCGACVEPCPVRRHRVADPGLGLVLLREEVLVHLGVELPLLGEGRGQGLGRPHDAAGKSRSLSDEPKRNPKACD